MLDCLEMKWKILWGWCQACQGRGHGHIAVHEANLKNMFVCCLSTQNFQTRLVGRIKLFLLPVQEKDTILRLNCLKIAAKKS